MNRNKYLVAASNEAYDATAHSGAEKTWKWLTDKLIWQPFSRLVKEYMASCET